MLALLLILTGAILGGVGAWFHNARIVGLGVVSLGLAMLLPYVD